MDKLKESISKYKAVGIRIEVDGIKVYIEQFDIFNAVFLTKEELQERAKALFPKNIIIAKEFQLNKDVVTSDFIKKNMRSRKEIIKHLNLDKSSLSLMLSGKQGLTKGWKAAFYYYFKLIQLDGRDKE